MTCFSVCVSILDHKCSGVFCLFMLVRVSVDNCKGFNFFMMREVVLMHVQPVFIVRFLIFRDIVMECTNDVCGMRSVGGQRRKGSGWSNEEVGRAVAEKRRTIEKWLQRRDILTNDRYRAQRVVVKRRVKVAKRMADWRWGERLGNNFEGNQ